MPEKKSVNFIFSAKMIILFHRLPLGGKLLAKQGGEGQPNNIQVFFSKSRFILNPHSRLPRRGSCRLLPTEEVFACLPLSLRQAFPLPEKKFSKLHFFRQKLSATSWLPLGGKLLAKQGDEGQPNNIQPFSLQKAALYSTRIPCFPLRGKWRASAALSLLSPSGKVSA